MSITMRIEIEKKIARCAVRSIISAGYAITVESEGVALLTNSINLTAIIDEMFNLDEVTLVVTEPKIDMPVGWVLFVFGNDGYDCIHDHTSNLEGILATATLLAEKYAS